MRGCNEKALIDFVTARGYYTERELDALRLLAANGVDRESAAEVCLILFKGQEGDIIRRTRLYIEVFKKVSARPTISPEELDQHAGRASWLYDCMFEQFARSPYSTSQNPFVWLDLQ